jgi:hypothetical protein
LETETFEKTAVQLMTVNPVSEVEKGCTLLVSKLTGQNTPDVVEIAFGGGTGSRTYKEKYDSFSLGLRAGYNSMNASSSSVDLNTNPTFGLQIGLVGDHAVNANFAIQWGFLFAMQSFEYGYSETRNRTYTVGSANFTETKYEESGTVSASYIQIPVNFQWKPDLGSAKFMLQAGPYFGFALGGDITGEYKLTRKYTTTKFGMTGDDNRSGNFNNEYNAFEFGLGLGAGFQFGKFQIGLGYNIGLNKVNNNHIPSIDKNEGFPDVREDVSLNNNTFVVTGTILFR